MPFGIGEHWVKAEGLVVASRQIGSQNLGTWRTEWVIEVHPTDGGVFRSAIKEPMVEHDDFRFRPVSEGETIGVEYDLKDGKLRWDKSDPRTNILARRPDAEKARQEQAFNDALAGRTPPPTDRP